MHYLIRTIYLHEKVRQLAKVHMSQTLCKLGTCKRQVMPFNNYKFQEYSSVKFVEVKNKIHRRVTILFDPFVL